MVADLNPIRFSFCMEGGGIFEGEVAFRQLSEIFSGRIIYSRGDSFKVVVPFCLNFFIYKISEKGTFWVVIFYMIEKAG